MTDSKPKSEIVTRGPDDLSFLSELNIIGINHQIMLRSNREQEDLTFQANLGLHILEILEKGESVKRQGVHDVL